MDGARMKIGVDPGIVGAIAVLQSDYMECLGLFDMPVMTLGKNKHQVNAAELTKILRRFQRPDYPSLEQPTVYLEQVNAMPGQGVSSMFNFGMGYGVVQGICAALGYPMVLVRPNAWKKIAGLINKPKEAARTLAQQLYPEQDLSLKKHVGRADALLLARFGFMC
jgi:crossover junction endodeoxyribonuclease RuvC